MRTRFIAVMTPKSLINRQTASRSLDWGHEVARPISVEQLIDPLKRINDMRQQLLKRFFSIATVIAALQASSVLANGALENPAAGSTQSGIGMFSGWNCEAENIEIEFTGGTKLSAAYGTARGDTASICGDSDNGFGLLFNFNNLGSGEHTVIALADGVEFGRSTFNVVRPSTGEFLRGASASVVVSDFPQQGHTVTLEWAEAQQNFNIVAEAIPVQSQSGVVFQYGQVDPQWSGGFKAFDEGIDYNECEEASGCPNLDWEIVSDEERNDVLEIRHTGAGFAGFYIQAFDPGLDMNDFYGGYVNFDIKVVEAGSSPGFTMKVDCIYPCGSAENDIGSVGRSGWETVSVKVTDLVASGLQLGTVTTGLVIWPSRPQEGVVYRLDNIYWSD